uniref:G protein-coupled receptor class C group 5 member C n=2 Tax=Cynoglossus semilaevis TaxID=244447 RepID=A0A3P8VS58_CYNSE
MDPTTAPRGCGSSIRSDYYNLCDLTKVWGIVLEAVAAAGVVTSLVLFIILLACVPFITDKKRKSMAALQAVFLLFTLGLFGLTFAFIVEQNSVTCAVRRFLFGVLFAGCFICLMMHGLWISLLEWDPKGWQIYLGALGLWLIEVIINTEWLIITVVRQPGGDITLDPACNIANKDFVMALIYVLFLMLAMIFIAIRTTALRQKQWHKDGVFILITGLITLAIWVTWIIMYIDGNRLSGNASWNDPTLAIAVVSNALVFLFLYTVPEVCLLTQQDQDIEEPNDGDHVYTPRNLVYDNTQVPEKPHMNVYLDNKAFELHETPATKPTSPYAAYNGQVRSKVYQPTELALISQGMTQVEKDAMISRATTP